MAYRQRRRSLAGTNGIPLEEERVYIAADTCDPSLMPMTLYMADGSQRSVRRLISRREYGRDFLGNLCVGLIVDINGRNECIWWEDGRWFARKRKR